MILKPRHLAAAQYSVMAIFLVATWYLLLSPFNRAIRQLEVMFATSYDERTFLVLIALATVVAVFLAVAYWFPRSASYPFSLILSFVAVAVFGVALWQFSATLIFGFGFGSGLALWTCYEPNAAINRGHTDKRHTG